MNFRLFSSVCTSFLIPLLSGLVVLYAGNKTEFQTGFLTLLQPLLPFIFLLPLVSIFLLCFLPEKLKKNLTLLFIALSIYLFVQGNFFIWDYGVFDGSDINWSSFNLLGSLEIIFLSVTFVLVFLFSERVYKQSHRISASLLILQVLTVFPLFSGMQFFTDKQISPIDPVRAFSKKQNILMIILDGFASPMFDQIINEKPAIKDAFSGFTYFQDTLAAFTTTAPSIPAMMTGKNYDNSIPFREFLERTMKDSSPQKFKEKGWDVSVVSLPQMCDQLSIQHCMSISSAVAQDEENFRKAELARLLDLWIFRYSPHFLKPYIYNDDNWLLQQGYNLAQGPKHQSESQLFAQSFAENVVVNDGPPTFKVLHILLPHPPFRFDENCQFFDKGSKKKPADPYKGQAKCALSLAVAILDKIKGLGIWDNTSVVITADHGARRKNLSFGEREGFPKIERAMPLLLVRASKENKESFEINQKPLTLLQLPFIVESLSNNPTQDEFVASLPSQTERIYRHYYWRNRDWRGIYMPPMQEYTVKGASREINNWRLGPLLDPKN